MPKIIPNLWFDNQAQEAAEYYCAIFPNSQVKEVAHYTDAGPGEPGTVLSVEFLLDGQPFVAINGGPHDKFNDAISLQVDCDDQEEVDYFWARLTANGSEVQCGWLKDKFGVSWQVVPDDLGRLTSDPDREKADRVIRAMLEMKKIDVAALYAAAGESEKKTGVAAAVKNVARKLTGGSKNPPSRPTATKAASLKPAAPKPTLAKKSPPKKVAVKKTAAKKTAAKKTPAAKSVAAKKAPPTKTTARKSPAKKAAKR